jgi:hypothetical protein
MEIKEPERRGPQLCSDEVQMVVEMPPSSIDVMGQVLYLLSSTPKALDGMNISPKLVNMQPN